MALFRVSVASAALVALATADYAQLSLYAGDNCTATGAIATQVQFGEQVWCEGGSLTTALAAESHVCVVFVARRASRRASRG